MNKIQFLTAGVTGPVLVYDEALFKFTKCQRHQTFFSSFSNAAAKKARAFFLGKQTQSCLIFASEATANMCPIYLDQWVGSLPYLFPHLSDWGQSCNTFTAVIYEFS